MAKQQNGMPYSWQNGDGVRQRVALARHGRTPTIEGTIANEEDDAKTSA